MSQELIIKESSKKIKSFLSTMSSEHTVEILILLNKTPCKYTEAMRLLDYRRPKSSKFSYHIRKLLGLQIISKNRDGVYHTTFLGEKICELYSNMLKIVNLDMSDPSIADTPLDIEIKKSELWLRPFLRQEFEKIQKTKDNDCISELNHIKIPKSEMWCGCLPNLKKFKSQDRFIQHLIDEHLSSIPVILEKIKKTIEVQKGETNP